MWHVHILSSDSHVRDYLCRTPSRTRLTIFAFRSPYAAKWIFGSIAKSVECNTVPNNVMMDRLEKIFPTLNVSLYYMITCTSNVSVNGNVIHRYMYIFVLVFKGI